MPEAFGTFDTKSFILYDTVCKPCNGHFGRTIEQALSRDSMEALLRLRHGVKPANEARDLPYRKIELKVGQPGPWLGATVVLEADGTGKGIEPVAVPQVAFRWKGSSESTYIAEAQLDHTSVGPFIGAKPDTLEIRILGPKKTDHDRLAQTLKTLGINFVQKGTLSQPIPRDGKVTIEIAFQLDHTIFRAIAKIAFNYIAHQHGAGFVLNTDFDDVRNYIRQGTVPPWGPPVVIPFPKPILFDDSRRYRQTNGHLITFDWNYGQTGFLAQVSLFNSITYHVVICPRYSGVWHDAIRTGHHFDLEDRTITPLAAASLVASPWR